ncbi:MAG: tetratricopeptide repeat protein [Gemmatimonadaceae bacterium]|nr:tetratricopeptide repeat protein [Gemmatimonadaceae bacterium]
MRHTPLATPALIARDADTLRAIAVRVPVTHANAQNSCGVLLARRGLHAEAAACFERALDADPRHPTAADNLRRLATLGTVDADRVATLTTRLRGDGEDVEAALALGRWHARMGRPAEARPVLATLVKRRPDDLATLRELAVVEHACGDVNAALAWLERALAVAGDDAALHAQLGELLYRSGRPDAARAALERATTLAPEVAWPHHMLAFVLGDLGEMDRAQASARHALSLDPALARVEAALTLEPRPTRGAGAARAGGGASAHVQLANAYRNTGYHDQALAELAAARTAGAPLEEVLTATIAVHALRGDWDAALASCDERIAAAPDAAGPRASRAALLLRRGDAHAAHTAAGEALALDAAHGAALLAMGVACALLGDTAAALATAQRARGQARLEAAARCNSAWLLRQIGRSAPALEGFRRVTELQPHNVRAWIGMGVALMDLRRPTEAIAALEQAASLEVDGGDAAHHLALALSQCGRWREGLAAMKRAVASESDFAPFRYEVVLDPDVSDLVLEIPAGDLLPTTDAAERLQAVSRTPGGMPAVSVEAHRAAFTGAARLAATHGTPHTAWVALRRGTTPPLARTPTGAQPQQPPLELVLAPARRSTGIHRAVVTHRSGVQVPVGAWREAPPEMPERRVRDQLPLPPAGDEGELRAMLARDPDLAAARVRLAAVLRRDGRDAEAEAHLAHALDVVPTFRDASRALSELYVDTGRPADALQVLVRPLRADPTDAGLLVASSEALLADRRDEAALAALTRATQLAPDHPGVRTLRGWLAMRDGRMRDAVLHWEVAASAPFDARWSWRARRALAEHESRHDVPAAPLAHFTAGAR